MPSSPRKILLIGWDSADWRILDPLLAAGAMPALASLIARGVRGNLATVEPVLSPAVWTTIATGKFPFRHGVLGFVEPDPLSGGIRNTGSSSRHGAALWNILSHSSLPSHSIGWFASHPAEPINGLCLSDRFPLATAPLSAPWPVPDGSVHPPERAPSLATLRVHPAEIEGDQLLPFVPSAASLDQSDDLTRSRLQQIALILSSTASLQAAATHVLEHEPWNFLGVYFRALDEFAHHFMPFHPPLLPGISPTDAATYGNVITTACRFHDAMLARMLHLAGPDTTVILVSDHGFESGHLRPGTRADQSSSMAQWHRPFGIFVMAGPGIVSNETITGATVLDITPTILHLCGLPVADDMDGKVMVTALENPEPIRRIPSWDHIRPVSPNQPLSSSSAAEEKLLMDQLAGLGYIDDASASAADLAAQAAAELRYNRVASLAQASHLNEASSEASSLADDFPSVLRYRLKAIQVLLMQGNLPDAKAALLAAESLFGPSEPIARMKANLLAASGQPADALLALDAIPADSQLPAVHEQSGSFHLQLRNWQPAEAAFRRALTLEPDNPGALLGLASALARQDHNDDAAAAALKALELQYWFPAAHFRLGAILSKSADFERAAASFETGLSMQPGNLMAHRYLARIYLRLGQPDRAVAHRAVVRTLTANSSTAPGKTAPAQPASAAPSAHSRS